MTLEFADPPQVGGGLGEDLLDSLRPPDELTPDRQKRRDRTGDVRSGHAGATVLDVVQRVALAGRLVAHRASASRQDALTRRDEIGLGAAVAGGALRGEVGDPV